MQSTRLNQLVGVTNNRLGQWLQNPWRRISVIAMSLLFGTFLGLAIASVSGQESRWDIVVSTLVVLITEVISWLSYRRQSQTRRPLWLEILNSLKIGVVYSLYLLAFILGS
ncbi:MAG: DUF565 domain-containing protein [Oscillatoriales cyanobacterium RM1_1_9]|nr:DUF565 domain-containing protein [Oscillatoriales cyanobacterium SM2_3_0]NJO47286.1 DUF565 domain-containing protein [Oscillatoriales cyanobacterium RM2_1_1]NJO71337.1 DUF565 domain-containing protein [Oscillatoriales cyanobacterium RM1_1_9]